MLTRVLQSCLCAWLLMAACTLPSAAALDLDLDRLAERGLDWDSVQRDGLTWVFERVRAPGLQARRARITLAAPPRLELDHVRIDLARLRRPQSTAAPVAADRPAAPVAEVSGSPALDLPEWLLDVSIHDLGVQWRERSIVEAVDVRLRDGLLEVNGRALSGTAQVQGSRRLSGVGRIDLGWLSARIEADVDRAAHWPLQLRVRQLRLDGERIGRVPVKLAGVDMRLRRASSGWLGELDAGAAHASLGLRCGGADQDGGCQASMDLPPTPVAALLTQVSELLDLPELPYVSGDLSVYASYSTAGSRLDLDARLDGFAVEGSGLDIEALRHGRFSYPVRDAGGQQVLRESGEGSDGWVSLYEVAEVLPAAVRAAEDGRFDHHGGYDIRAMTQVVEEVVNEGRRWRGASTITQQLVKNLFFDPRDRSLQRKLQELLVAAELDASLGKERVMELYLNIVEWGPGVHGIGPATGYYLGRRADELTPLEAAWLVTALPSPARFHAAWESGRERWRGRVESILYRLQSQGWLSNDELQVELEQPLPGRCDQLAGVCLN